MAGSEPRPAESASGGPRPAESASGGPRPAEVRAKILSLLLGPWSAWGEASTSSVPSATTAAPSRLSSLRGRRLLLLSRGCGLFSSSEPPPRSSSLCELVLLSRERETPDPSFGRWGYNTEAYLSMAEPKRSRLMPCLPNLSYSAFNSEGLSGSGRRSL